MRFIDILNPERVSVAGAAEGVVASKPDALRRLGYLLSQPDGVAPSESIERVLSDRERLHSTGVGGGVAIPHGTLDGLPALRGAVLIVPDPIEFDAIDKNPVSILFALVGPKGKPGEHLKTLARISRLLREERFRAELLKATSGSAAFKLIAAEESRGSSP